MKNYYLLLFLGFWLTLTTTLAQPIRQGGASPESPTLRGQKSAAPFVGLTVNIPLWKVLGRKKAKVLPKSPVLNAEQRLVDEASSSGTYVAPERGAGENTVMTIVGKPVKKSKKAKKGKAGDGISPMGNTGNEQTDECHCTDWYIVTTERGTGRVVSEEYVGTTCSGNCEGTGGGGDGSEGGGGAPTFDVPTSDPVIANLLVNCFSGWAPPNVKTIRADLPNPNSGWDFDYNTGMFQRTDNPAIKAGALTYYSGGQVEIILSPAIFQNRLLLYTTVAHEFLHALHYQQYTEMFYSNRAAFNANTEYAAYNLSLSIMNQNGGSQTYINQFQNGVNHYAQSQTEFWSWSNSNISAITNCK